MGLSRIPIRKIFYDGEYLHAHRKQPRDKTKKIILTFQSLAVVSDDAVTM